MKRALQILLAAMSFSVFVSVSMELVEQLTAQGLPPDVLWSFQVGPTGSNSNASALVPSVTTISGVAR